MQKWHKVLGFILIGTLMGCNFKPIHYSAAANDDKLTMLSLKPTKSTRDDSKLAWEFDKMLASEISRAANALPATYTLQANLSTSLSNAVIQADSTVSRKTITIMLDYQIIKIADSKVIASGSINAADSFNVTDAPFSNYMTEAQSKSKLLSTIAAELRYRLYSVLIC